MLSWFQFFVLVAVEKRLDTVGPMVWRLLAKLQVLRVAGRGGTGRRRRRRAVTRTTMKLTREVLLMSDSGSGARPAIDTLWERVTTISRKT